MNSLAPRNEPRRQDDRDGDSVGPAQNEPLGFRAPARDGAGAARGATSPDGVDRSLFVRQRRVHFDVEREYVDGPSGRIAAGWTLRLFALHEQRAHDVPGCRCCARLSQQLRQLADAALADGSADAVVEVEGILHALYESSALPGRDEVALAVRIWSRTVAGQARGGDRPAEQFRRSLKRLGLAET